jgi:hypothetical protein
MLRDIIMMMIYFFFTDFKNILELIKRINFNSIITINHKFKGTFIKTILIIDMMIRIRINTHK